MSHKDQNIDQLFLKKTFHELTQNEKKEISEIATTEAEFNDVKMMLIAIEKEISSIKDIEPKSSTKEHLISEFNKIRPTKTVRPKMGLGILFPSEKSFFQKPGIQILAIAAIVVLIFTLFIPSKDVLKEQSDTAQVSKKNVLDEDKIVKETIPTKNEEVKKIENADSSMENLSKITDPMETNAEKSAVIDKTYPSPVSANKNTASDVIVEASTIPSTYEAEEDVASEVINLDNIDIQNEDSKDISAPAADEVLAPVATGNTHDLLEDFAVVEEMTDDSDITALVQKNKKVRQMSEPVLESSDLNTKNTIKTSKTLSENKELIKYFYTAM